MICCYPGQDVLRLQTLADERELTVEKVQKREDNSSEKACFAIWNHDENHDWWLFFWLEKSALIQLKKKFHRERKARIFRGWLCGFRTYFQYIYIYPYLLLQHLWLLEISFRLLRCKSAYKRCRVRCSQKLVTFGFKVLHRKTLLNMWELRKMPLRNVGNCKKQKLSFTEQGNRSLPWGSQLWL